MREKCLRSKDTPIVFNFLLISTHVQVICLALDIKQTNLAKNVEQFIQILPEAASKPSLIRPESLMLCQLTMILPQCVLL